MLSENEWEIKCNDDGGDDDDDDWVGETQVLKVK